MVAREGFPLEQKRSTSRLQLVGDRRARNASADDREVVGLQFVNPGARCSVPERSLVHSHEHNSRCQKRQSSANRGSPARDAVSPERLVRSEWGIGKLGQLTAAAVHLAAENERGQSAGDHREDADFVDPQDHNSLFAPFGKPLATEAEHLEWIDAEKASDEGRRALHAAAVEGQIAASNASNPDRDQNHDGEQVDQSGGPESEAGIHRVSRFSGFPFGILGSGSIPVVLSGPGGASRPPPETRDKIG